MKFLKYLLVFMLGFVTCFGGVVGGGYYLFTSVTLSDVEDLTGSTIISDDSISADAEVQLKSLSIKELIAEMNEISSISDGISLEFVVNRYGIVLPQNVVNLIPDSAMSVSLQELINGNGIETVLSQTKVDFLYQHIPDGTLSEPAKEALKDKSLQEVIDGDLAYLLEDVKLGYLAGVEYEKVGANYKPVYKDSNNPTFVELISEVNLADLITTLGEGGNLFEVLAVGAGEVLISDLIESISSGESLLGGDKTLSELFPKNTQTGEYEFSVDALIGDKYLGELMGYEPIYDLDGENIISWTKDSENIDTVSEILADVKVSEFLSGELNLNTVFEDVYIGDLMGFEAVYDSTNTVITGWLNEEDGVSVEVEGVDACFANISLIDCINGDISLDDTGITTTITIGELLSLDEVVYPIYDTAGQVSDKDNDLTYSIWYEDGKEVNPFLSVIAGKTIDEVSLGLDDLNIGNVIGGVLIDGIWHSGEVREVNGEKVYYVTATKSVIARFANIKVTQFDEESAFIDCINGLYVGEALGYTKEDDGWYDSNNVKVTGIISSLVDCTIAELKEDGKIYDAISTKSTGEIMGYYLENGVWYTDESKGTVIDGINGKIANLTIDELKNQDSVLNAISDISLGELLGYTKDGSVWYNGEDEVKGIIGSLCDLTIDDIKNEDKVLQSIDNTKIGELLNYDSTLYGVWHYADGTEVTGLMAVMCDCTLANLGERVDELTINDVFSSAELESGALSLLDGSTKLSELDSEIDEMFATTTMQEYITAGVLHFDNSQTVILTAFLGTNAWLNWDINTFIDNIINKISSVSGAI